jgi:hypothetical protein
MITHNQKTNQLVCITNLSVDATREQLLAVASSCYIIYIINLHLHTL